MDDKGCWRDNVFVERLRKSIRYKEVYLRTYETVSVAKSGIGCYLEFYISRRPPSTLDAKTPEHYASPPCPRCNRRRSWQTGLPTAPRALALRMGRRAAPWITLPLQGST
jgi:putative transposase